MANNDSFSSSSLTDSDRTEFMSLKAKAKALAKCDRLEEALGCLKKAFKINLCPKIKKHIQGIENVLNDYGNTSVEMVEVTEGFYMIPEILENLYPYQREAVIWMWELFKKKKGGVLGDDMGLGKTIQIIAFLSSMMDGGHIKAALLIMPVSLIENWKREFKKWAPEVLVKKFHESKGRHESLAVIQRSGGVLLTTYGIVIKNAQVLCESHGRNFVWDYVVLDEGHKIKNPTKTTKAIHDLLARHRLVLTGTPIQNNLKEFWALYDFVHQGTLLGSMKTFKMMYETPILRSREKDATEAEKMLGNKISENLRTLIAPFFLRRTKQEVLQDVKEDSNGVEDQSAFAKLKREMMIQKNEFMMWVYLSPIQIKIYQDFLDSDRVKNILMSKRSPLVELTVLKKICDHPRLLSHRACMQLGLEGDMTEEQLEQALENDPACYFDIKNTPDNTLIEESGKMVVLFQLLENLMAENHRTLIFSQSCRILDIIQKVLHNRDCKVLRLDGKIRKTIDREKVISTFQKDLTYPVLLLTTQVGGVGLTLTGADRVVIYDPSWNPATDAQAVDRAYRIGQTKSVVVYRLVTCGSVEEKIYRRQIFKDSIHQQTTGAKADPHRYFTRQELKELFVLDNPKYSSTQQQLEAMHSSQRKTDTALDTHIAFLYSTNIFGISDHDLMFKVIAEENNEEAHEEYVQERVKEAEMLVTLESNLVKESLIQSGAFAKPFTVPVKEYSKSGNSHIVDRYRTEYEIPIPSDVSVEDLTQELSDLDVGDTPKKHQIKQLPSEVFEVVDSEDEVQIKEKLAVAKQDVDFDSKRELEVFIKSEKLEKNHSDHQPSTKENHLNDFIEVSDDEEFQNSPFETTVKEHRREDLEVSDTATEPCESSEEEICEDSKDESQNGDLHQDSNSSTDAYQSEDEFEFDASPGRKSRKAENDHEKNSASDGSMDPCESDEDEMLEDPFVNRNTGSLKKKVLKKKARKSPQNSVVEDSDDEIQNQQSLQHSKNSIDSHSYPKNNFEQKPSHKSVAIVGGTDISKQKISSIENLDSSAFQSSLMSDFQQKSLRKGAVIGEETDIRRDTSPSNKNLKRSSPVDSEDEQSPRSDIKRRLMFTSPKKPLSQPSNDDIMVERSKHRLLPVKDVSGIITAEAIATKYSSPSFKVLGASIGSRKSIRRSQVFKMDSSEDSGDECEFRTPRGTVSETPSPSALSHSLSDEEPVFEQISHMGEPVHASSPLPRKSHIESSELSSRKASVLRDVSSMECENSINETSQNVSSFIQPTKKKTRVLNSDDSDE